MVEKEAKREHEMMFAPLASPCPGENHSCLIPVYNMHSVLFKTHSCPIPVYNMHSLLFKTLSINLYCNH